MPTESNDLSTCCLHARLMGERLVLELRSSTGCTLAVFNQRNKSRSLLALLFYRRLLAQHIEAYEDFEWRTRQELCQDHDIPASRPRRREHGPRQYNQIHQYITPLNSAAESCFQSPSPQRLIESRKDEEGTMEYRLSISRLSLEQGSEHDKLLEILHGLYLTARTAESVAPRPSAGPSQLGATA